MRKHLNSNNVYSKNIRIMASFMCAFSFIFSIAHLLFKNTPQGVPFGGFYDIYNCVVYVGSEVTIVMFAVGVLLGAYRTCVVPTLLLGLFNLTEYTLRFLLYDLKWTWFCFVITCTVLWYVRSLIIRSEILFDKEVLEIRKEIKDSKVESANKLEALDREEKEILAKLQLNLSE